MPQPGGSWDRSTKEIEEIVMKFNKDEEKVAITGGEPTIRPDLFHLLKFIKNAMPNSKIFLLTNGRMFYYPQFTRKFIDTGCDSVAIPLHAENAKLHDKITRTPGSFKQTVQGIKNLLKYKGKVDVEIRIVIHKLNYRHFPAIASYIAKEFKGIRRVVPFPIDIIGNANANRNKLIVRMIDIKPFLERGLGILERDGIEFSIFHIPFCIIDKKYWKNIAGRTVEERRITFQPCNGCVMRQKCPGIWKTYALRVGTGEFKPIVG
jgi:His-Xaa-Ser system radical SAM maturase HxsC